jgi:hypothetical protein
MRGISCACEHSFAIVSGVGASLARVYVYVYVYVCGVCVVCVCVCVSLCVCTRGVCVCMCVHVCVFLHGFPRSSRYKMYHRLGISGWQANRDNSESAIDSLATDLARRRGVLAQQGGPSAALVVPMLKLARLLSQKASTRKEASALLSQCLEQVQFVVWFVPRGVRCGMWGV